MLSDCEQLIRRMLVLEPRRRYTINQVRQHKWMKMGEGRPDPIPGVQVYPTPPAPTFPTQLNTKITPELNDQILRLMQQLGIDQQKTIEVWIVNCNWPRLKLTL